MLRKRRPVKQLTAEELKTKLYSHFDKSGSLNRMRSELRGKLVSELLKVAAPLESTSTDEVIVDFDRALLPLQVSNWLVYDHLLRQGHQYALSIFVTEANLPQPEKLLTASDILCLFGLDSSTAEYKSISKMYSANDELGRLHSLLLAVIKALLNLREDKLPTADAFEKHCLEDRSKEPVDKLSSKHILLGERDQEVTYQDSGLKQSSTDDVNRSSGLNERFQFAIGEKEREIQSLRQKLLQELDRLHSQERSQQMEIENERMEMRKERDALFVEKEKLRERELLMTKEYENKLERRVRELEVDFTSKLHMKDKSQEDLQRRLFEKEQRLSQMEVDFSSQRSSNDVLRKELEDMRSMCKSVQEKYSSLLDDNTNLLRKFESMSDYAVVKGELEAKSHQVAALRREIDDTTKVSEKERAALTEIVRNLEMQLKAKESELLEAHRQLKVTRDTLHMEEAAWSKERRKLEQETLASRDMYKTFIHRLEEQKEDIQALHQTIHLLHYQLTEKNVRSSSRPDPLMHHRVAFSKSEAARNDSDVFRINRNFKDSPPKYKESSLKFIEDAKSRIGRLQKEADALQDKCSVVYSSVPEFNGQFLSNPLTYNVAGIRSSSLDFDLTKKFSTNLNDRFNNLIENEMPTLDLNLPANIKSKLCNVFADNYVSQAATPMSIPTNITSFGKPPNTSTGEVSNSGLDRIVSPTDALEHNQYIRNTTKAGSYNLTDDVPETTVPQSANLRDDLPRRNECSKVVETIQKSFVSNNSILTAPIQQEKHTYNIPSSPSKVHVPTEAYFPPHQSKLQESVSQVNKAPLSNPDTLESKEQETGGTSSADCVTEVLKPEKHQQAGEESVTKLREELVLGDRSKLVSDVKNDTVPEISSFSKQSVDVPVVIDLDAAWKRKTSLVPSDLPSEHLPLSKLPTLKETFNLESSLNTAPGNFTGFKSSIPKSNYQESKQDPADSPTLNVSDTHSNRLSSGDADQISIQPKCFEGVQDFDHEQLKIKSVDGQHQSQTEELVHKDAIDAEIVEDLPRNVKPVHEDSLSELSEIHLSCGSEQEEQKEDSDNW